MHLENQPPNQGGKQQFPHCLTSMPPKESPIGKTYSQFNQTPINRHYLIAAGFEPAMSAFGASRFATMRFTIQRLIIKAVSVALFRFTIHQASCRLNHSQIIF